LDWWWFLLLGLILTLIFTVIINNYWPILFSIYKQIKIILRKERSASREMILMVANTENNTQIDNRDKNFLNQINADMEKLQNKNIWSWKDKLLAVWILICIIGSLIISLVASTLIFTFFINSRELNQKHNTSFWKKNYQKKYYQIIIFQRHF
jgi:hypothetical protein